jgi:O-antigen ligase
VSFLIVNLADANMEALGSRLDLIEITGTSSDASYVERSRQTKVAWETFQANPVLGAGPGTTFVWERINGVITASFTMDTPLTFLAKFGLVGILAVLVIVSRYWRFTRSLVRDGGPTVEKLALVGYLAVAVAIIPANSPLEDKGFSLGLMLLLALALSGSNVAHASSDSAVYRRAPLG